MIEATRIRAYALPVIGTLIYAIIVYQIFRAWEELELVSASFICGMPFVVGILAVVLAPAEYRTRKAYGVFVPWIPMAALCLTAIVVGWELVVCVVMAMPALLTLSSGGGLAVMSFYRSRTANGRYMLHILALLPFLIVPIENLFPQQNDILNAESSIHINADVQTVWEEIIAVPEIRPEERPFSVLDVLAFPRPMEAQLSHEGVGGMRRASYDNGMVLWEPVTIWEPNQHYAFDVQVDDHSPKPFTSIGGAYFDVLEVSFTIEDADDGGALLILNTRYRLSTRINFYARYWTGFLTRDLQHTILHIVKNRAENKHW